MTAVPTGPADRRRRTRSIRRLVGATLAVGVLTAGLASGPAFAASGSTVATRSVSPSTWWGSVCTSLGSYQKDTAKLEKTFDAAIKQHKSLSSVKNEFATFLQASVNRAKQLVSELKKAGTPNAPSGPQFSNAISAGFEQLRAGFDSLVPQARGVPTSSQAGFKAAFTSIVNQINTLETQNQTTFQAAEPFSSAALNTAFQHQQVCKSLGG